MPYIPKEDRSKIIGLTIEQAGQLLNHPGDLNFAVTVLCAGYIERELNYRRINEAI